MTNKTNTFTDLVQIAKKAKPYILDLLRAQSPCDSREIEFELVDQCPSVSWENVALIQTMALAALIQERQVQEWEQYPDLRRKNGPAWETTDARHEEKS